MSKSIESGEDSEFVYIEPRIRARVKMRKLDQSGYAADSGILRVYSLARGAGVILVFF